MALSFINTKVPREWWSDSPTSIAAIRAKLDKPDFPTEIVNRLLRVLEEMEPLIELGDQLYNFSSPSIAWENMMGTGGYVIVRDGVVIHAIMTVCN
ncbi:MAG TPA: hypothetical protein DDZ51_00675 [Planctomycetaceae bacterium]|nr:hypothetical protein [Planctomycetaceae bacterium]